MAAAVMLVTCAAANVHRSTTRSCRAHDALNWVKERVWVGARADAKNRDEYGERKHGNVREQIDIWDGTR